MRPVGEVRGEGGGKRRGEEVGEEGGRRRVEEARKSGFTKRAFCPRTKHIACFKMVTLCKRQNRKR